MKNLLLAVTLCVTGVFTPPHFLTAQVSQVFKSQSSTEYLHHTNLTEPEHNNRTFFDEQNQILYFGTTIFNSSTNKWDVLIQANDYTGGQFNNVLWKSHLNTMLPNVLNFQFHSMTGDHTNIYITITSNTSLFGTTDELHVLALDLYTGTIQWHYNNGAVDGNGLVRDIIIDTDKNGDLFLGFLKKAISVPATQFAGIIKLDVYGNEYWAKGCAIPTSYQGGQFLDLHDIGHESANGKYVMTGIFDHSGSTTDIGIFSIYADENTGIFSAFHEVIPIPFSGCLDRDPAMYVFPDHFITAYRDNCSATGLGMIEMYNGVVTNRVTYTIPAGKSEMHFLKIIQMNTGDLMALLHLETSAGLNSFAVARIHPTTLLMSSPIEIDFIAGYNEEIGIDLLVGDNNIYSLSSLLTFAGVPATNPNNYWELKITNIYDVLQGNSCFPTNTHISTVAPYQYFNQVFSYTVTQTNYSGGGYISNYFVNHLYNGYRLDCNNNIQAQYKTSSTNTEPKINITNPNTNQVTITGVDVNTIEVINLYDLKGALIKHTAFTGNHNVNIEYLKSGIYILELTLKNGTRTQKRLIKN